MRTMVYEKGHFRSAKDLYAQIAAFYSTEEIIKVIDNDNEVVVLLK